MTLQDLGNLGQLIGSVAVVVSLVYLAAQIRQNSRLLRGAAIQAQNESGIPAIQAIARDLATSDLFNRGRADMLALSEAERTQFSLLLALQFIGFQNALLVYNEGLLSEDQWNRQKAIMRLSLASQGVQQWWRSLARYNLVSESFRRFVETELNPGLSEGEDIAPPAGVARRGAAGGERR